MKKLSIVSAIMGLAFIGTASAANITIYHSPSCPHCHHAREFISQTLVYEYPELTVTEVNVTNGDQRPAFEEALKKCEYESGGVPVLVIGEKCFQGYADFMQQELRDAIEVDLTDEQRQLLLKTKRHWKKTQNSSRPIMQIVQVRFLNMFLQTSRPQPKNQLQNKKKIVKVRPFGFGLC